MTTIDYLGYKIIYFPEEFNLHSGRYLKSITPQIIILKNNRQVAKLMFCIPIPKSFSAGLKTQEIIDLAIVKAREIINQGLENNVYKEFQFMESNFEEVIDTTE